MPLEQQLATHGNNSRLSGNLPWKTTLRESGHLQTVKNEAYDTGHLFEYIRTRTHEPNELQYQLTSLQALLANNNGERNTPLTHAELVESYGDLAAELRSAFSIEPIEHGYSHPAEGILCSASNQVEISKLSKWIEAFILSGEERPSFSESLLRCMGRIDRFSSPEWRAELIRNALKSPRVSFRDAAIQAAERWGGQEIADVLEKHNEPEAWLAEYITHLLLELRD